MEELMVIDKYDNKEQLVSGRELHKFLESKTDFSDWIKAKIEKYGFIEDEDFTLILGKSNGGRPSKEYILKLDIAKEISMVEGNKKGKQARQYFISIEKAWNSPELIMARAIKSANYQIDNFSKHIKTLEFKIENDKPRVEFAKTVEGTTEKITIGNLAKLTDGKIGRNKLFKLLRDKKVLMKGNIPYQKYIDRGYFEVSERVIKSAEKDIIALTTYVSGKGQVWILGKIEEWLKIEEEDE